MRHVERFVDLPLIGGAIAEIGKAQTAIFLVLMRQCETAAKRHLRADDPVSAIEFMFGREHVHRTALAFRYPGGATCQLGHDDIGIDAIGQHMAVIAIAGDHAVAIIVERALQSDRDRFLPDIQMAEAPDQPPNRKAGPPFPRTGG